MPDFVDALCAQRILPVLRLPDTESALAAARTALGAGLGIVELTATTRGWAAAVAALREEVPTAIVGLGTVTTRHLATSAVEAGAGFLVSPWPAPEVREVAASSGLPFLEGAFTPAEVADVSRQGPVKVFPAHLGGPQYLRSLRQVLPEAVLVPTGGIALADAAAWLDAGASAVGIGRDLVEGDDLHDRLGAALGRSHRQGRS